MGARELKHEAKLREWAERVRACRSSGKSVSEWCREQGVASKTYYTWEREILGRAGKAVMEVRPEGRIVAVGLETGQSEAAAWVRAGGVTVEIARGADAGTIRAILEAVRGC